jgi:hypothetical protein
MYPEAKLKVSQKDNKMTETYDSRYLLVVTHLTTRLLVRYLYRAELVRYFE